MLQEWQARLEDGSREQGIDETNIVDGHSESESGRKRNHTRYSESSVTHTHTESDPGRKQDSQGKTRRR